MEEPSTRTFSRLLSLPLEVFQQVTSFLFPSDITCLGLTCTGLWSLVADDMIQGFQQKDEDWPEQRMQLLRKLARDLADMIFCNVCLKLQQLHCDRALTVSNNWVRPPCHHLASHVSICKHFSITREMPELTLKPRKDSVSKFSRPDPFAHTCTWRTSGSGSTLFALSVASKLVKKKLYLRTVYDVDVKLDVKNNFNTPSMRGKGCLHAAMWLKKKCACTLQHAVNDGLSCASCSRAQRCAYCFTKFSVFAAKRSASTVHLQVRAYKYLGGGQARCSSSERTWVAHTTPLSFVKREEVQSHRNDYSLETVFERGLWEQLALGLPKNLLGTTSVEDVPHLYLRSHLDALSVDSLIA